MRLTQDDDMIQGLAANRSDQPFGEAILPIGRTYGCGLVGLCAPTLKLTCGSSCGVKWLSYRFLIGHLRLDVIYGR
jgi:hypothetical protein